MLTFKQFLLENTLKNKDSNIEGGWIDPLDKIYSVKGYPESNLFKLGLSVKHASDAYQSGYISYTWYTDLNIFAFDFILQKQRVPRLVNNLKTFIKEYEDVLNECKTIVLRFHIRDTENISHKKEQEQKVEFKSVSELLSYLEKLNSIQI